MIQMKLSFLDVDVGLRSRGSKEGVPAASQGFQYGALLDGICPNLKPIAAALRSSRDKS